MKFKNLDDENLMLYAIQHYDNPQCGGMEEFYQDLSILIYLKRLFKKYCGGGELKDRLILNHLITFYNVFGMEAATRILFLKIDSEYHHILKTFLLYLNYIKVGHNYSEWGLDIISIPLDSKLVNYLRKKDSSNE